MLFFNSFLIWHFEILIYNFIENTKIVISYSSLFYQFKWNMARINQIKT